MVFRPIDAISGDGELTSGSPGNSAFNAHVSIKVILGGVCTEEFDRSQVQCFLPFPSSKTGDLLGDDSVLNWKMSVASGEDIATIFRHWKPEYFAVADPFVCATVWFTICMLSLHTMSIYGQSEAGPDVKISNALDLLNVALGNFARRWQFSQILLGNSIIILFCCPTS